MAKYAVNEEGTQAMRSMASAITDAIEQVETQTSSVQSSVDE